MAVPDPLPVYYERFEVGRLQVGADGSVTFDYDPRWLATPGAFPLSLSMPLDQASHPPAVVAPWIANLLPEEVQLASLARTLGVDRNDALEILRTIGGDTAGALSFGEPSLREAWSYMPLEDFYAGTIGEHDPSAALARHFEDLARRPFLAGEDGVRLSLAGGQQKTALAVLGADGHPRLGLPSSDDRVCIPMHGAPSTVIIKPDNDRLPGIVENEAFCLTLARTIGLDAAQVGIRPAGRRNALVVARYDRGLRQDGGLRRFHQEDFAQVNALFPAQKYERGTLQGPSLPTLLRTGQLLPPKDALALMDQVIFNILVANTDAHAKNYSVLHQPTLRLSPLYDVSTVLPWDHVNQYFAQNLAGKKRKPGDMDARHWDALSDEAGFNPRQTRLRVEELGDLIFRHGLAVEEQIAAEPGAIPALVRQARECVEGNALRILGRLRHRPAGGALHAAASGPGA